MFSSWEYIEPHIVDRNQGFFIENRQFLIENPWDGVDFNRQWVTNWDEGQNGSGDFPFSEIEMRHLITFIHSHPKIFGIMGCKMLCFRFCAQAFSLI